MRWKRNSKAMRRKKYLVDGGIVYHQAEQSYPLRCHAVYVHEIFNLIVQEQTNSTHSGKNKTYTALSQQFFSIKHQEVAFLLKHCKTCAQTKPKTTRVSLHTIKTHSVFERIQIDLIDMSATPDSNTSGFYISSITFRNFQAALL